MIFRTENERAENNKRRIRDEPERQEKDYRKAEEIRLYL